MKYMPKLWDRTVLNHKKHDVSAEFVNNVIQNTILQIGNYILVLSSDWHRKAIGNATFNL